MRQKFFSALVQFVIFFTLFFLLHTAPLSNNALAQLCTSYFPELSFYEACNNPLSAVFSNTCGKPGTNTGTQCCQLLNSNNYCESRPIGVSYEFQCCLIPDCNTGEVCGSCSQSSSLGACSSTGTVSGTKTCQLTAYTGGGQCNKVATASKSCTVPTLSISAHNLL